MMKRAGFWLRLGATAIDFVAVAVVLTIVEVTVVMTRPILFGVDIAYDERAMGVVQTLLLLLYSLSEVLFSATPGKLILGLRITAASGEPADVWRRILRWLTKWFAFILQLFWFLTPLVLLNYLGGIMNLVIVVGCLPILGEDKLAWHDEWSGTAVCRRVRLPMTQPVAATT